jgi:hypothetical protein
VKGSGTLYLTYLLKEEELEELTDQERRVLDLVLSEYLSADEEERPHRLRSVVL